MSERNVIPIAAEVTSLPLPTPDGTQAWRNTLFPTVADSLGRPLRDLRISITDRCNFRCSYCMPKDAFGKDHAFLPRNALLSFEEIEFFARAFLRLGVGKIRLTGGEPLLRRGVEHLVARLAPLRTRAGDAVDLTLTTNGSLLARLARPLSDAGLRRVTVSLDALDDTVFRRMNDVDFPVAEVLRGIEAAIEAGLSPVKVNMVVKRGLNEHEVVRLARFVRDTYGPAVRLRFIEFMDVGATNGWRMDDVVPSSEVLAMLRAEFELEPLEASATGETAERWRYADGRGEVGFISSVTQAFCRDCNRARLSTEGRLFLCLFADRGHDLRSLLRRPEPIGEEALAAIVAACWEPRQDRYSELRTQATQGEGRPPRRRIEMSYIGG